MMRFISSLAGTGEQFGQRLDDALRDLVRGDDRREALIRGTWREGHALDLGEERRQREAIRARQAFDRLELRPELRFALGVFDAVNRGAVEARFLGRFVERHPDPGDPPPLGRRRRAGAAQALAHQFEIHDVIVGTR
jgi:hypothetical protein